MEAAERAGDLLRLAIATVLFTLTVLAIQRDRLSLFERDVFRLVNDLPPWLLSPVHLVEQLGGRWTPLAVGVLVVLVLGRIRLGLSIAAAGVAAWLTAQLLKLLIERPRPAEFLGDLPREWSSGGPGFVSGHTAVATAMAAAAAPYLSRPWRRLVWTLAALVGFARIYSGVHLPLDVVGGAAVGWFAGTAVHLLVGTSRARRTPEEVAAILTRLGVPVVHAESLEGFAEVSHPFRVRTTSGGRLFVKVLDPDPRRNDLLLRAMRLLASAERRQISAMVPLPEAADHEAAVTMAARNAGVRVPEVVLARGDRTGAVVVLSEVDGHDLAAADPDDVSEALLESVWRQVCRLHAAGIAHRDLVRANVLVDRAGDPWLLDFGDAVVGASAEDVDGDVSELVASLSVLVGPQRAVGPALRVLGEDAMARALPGLELFALSARTRREVRRRPGLLGAVRAVAGGGPEAASGLLRPRRLWLPATVGLAGYAFLLGLVGFGEVGTALADARWRWVGIAAAFYAAVPLLLGLALRQAVRRRIAVGRSALATAVASAVQLVGGPTARHDHLDRYVRSCGVRGADPRRAVDLLLVAELEAGVLVAGVGLGFDWWRGALTLELGAPVPALVGTALAAVVGGLFARGVVLRRWAFEDPERPDLRARGMWMRSSVREVLLHGARTARAVPGRSTAVLAATTAAEMAAVVALASAVHAFGPTWGFAVVATALSGTRVVLALLGVAGMPVVGEALTVAVLTAFGVDPVQAVLGVLVYAMFRYWLTAVLGVLVAPRLAPARVRTALRM